MHKLFNSAGCFGRDVTCCCHKAKVATSTPYVEPSGERYDGGSTMEWLGYSSIIRDNGNTDVICGVHLQMCHVFLHVRICTSHVAHSIYWREEKANKITVYISVFSSQYVSCGSFFNSVNYVSLMMFDSNHFCATHSLLLCHDLHGFPSIWLVFDHWEEAGHLNGD